MDTLKARALIDIKVDEKEINCGDVIEAETPLIMQLSKEGKVDASKSAVNYALENHAKITVIEAEEDSPPEDDSLPGDSEEDSEGEQVED